MIVTAKNTFHSTIGKIISFLMFGVMYGFFWTCSFNANYALNSMHADAYAGVQSLLNVNVRHSLFFLFFFGGALFSAFATLLSWF